jgi:hypothetical protein
MIEYGSIPDYAFSYDEAFLYCLTLDYNGHKDWRLPTPDEYNDSSAIFCWYTTKSKSYSKQHCLPVRDY